MTLVNHLAIIIVASITTLLSVPPRYDDDIMMSFLSVMTSLLNQYQSEVVVCDESGS